LDSKEEEMIAAGNYSKRKIYPREYLQLSARDHDK